MDQSKRIEELEKEVADYKLQEAYLIAQLKKKDEELQALSGCRYAR